MDSSDSLKSVGGTDMTNFKDAGNGENFVGTSPTIKVLGIGGAGNNAVRQLYEKGLNTEVELIAVNTEGQTLKKLPADISRIQIGAEITGGFGAGGDPEIGKMAAEESIDSVLDAVSGSDLIFLTLGLGGGTGTGSTPVIARAIKERYKNTLICGVMTMPFSYEGKRKKDLAAKSFDEIKDFMDVYIKIENDNILTLDTENSFQASEGFLMVDRVLLDAIRGILDLISKAGLVNVDFADVRNVMRNAGPALFGVAIAEGPERANKVAQRALESKLIERPIDFAKNILINIIGSKDSLKMSEVSQINKYIKNSIGMDANLKSGVYFDDDLGDKIKVVVIATGFDADISSGMEESSNISDEIEDIPAIHRRKDYKVPDFQTKN